MPARTKIQLPQDSRSSKRISLGRPLGEVSTKLQQFYDKCRSPSSIGLWRSLGVRPGVKTVGATKPPLTPRAVAEINPRMPRSMGDTAVPLERLDPIVEVDEPLPELVPPAPTEVTRRIGEHVAGLIHDGDCLQIGIQSQPFQKAGFVPITPLGASPIKPLFRGLPRPLPIGIQRIVEVSLRLHPLSLPIGSGDGPTGEKICPLPTTTSAISTRTTCAEHLDAVEG
jgi:hypothetical protein